MVIFLRMYKGVGSDVRSSKSPYAMTQHQKTVNQMEAQCATQSDVCLVCYFPGGVSKA